ncbi:hypothetical protein Q3G72_015982 [Acer saccharum]|nr:hypothetical protein Q3G72_015982 [Acer saccharum]
MENSAARQSAKRRAHSDKRSESKTELSDSNTRQERRWRWWNERSMRVYSLRFGVYLRFRTSGGPYLTTSYDYDAPLDEYAKY